MAGSAEPLTLMCPVRGILKAKRGRKTDLSASEERHRIDAIRHVIALGYNPKRIKIEAIVARFGHGGKNSFRCDFAVLDVDASSIDMSSETAVDAILEHAVILAEVKRAANNADYVRRTQVEPLLKFASRKDTLALYWDGVGPRVFWKEEKGRTTIIQSGPLALLPKPGREIRARPITYSALLPPTSLEDIFSRVEDELHSASIALEERYEIMLQLILAKIYDEHQGEAGKSLVFQDFQSLGVPAAQAKRELNDVLSDAVGFYSAHLPRPIEDAFSMRQEVLAEVAQILAPHLITAANKEVIESFYMKFAKDLYRWDLAQYFTPPTVTDFIVELLNPVSGETVKDPACGSADFLVATFHRARSRKIRNAADMTFGADSDRKAVQIAVLNMLLNGDGKTNIKHEDTLQAVAEQRPKKSKGPLYHAIVCNPPFGTKIVERRHDILKEFDLGHSWLRNDDGRWTKGDVVLDKQEKGILFAEACVRQTRPGGRIAIIIPNGYLGNRSDRYLSVREWLLRECRIVSVCGFPRFTFKTSGADVSTSAVLLERRKTPVSYASEDDAYVVNFELIESVGWSVGDKRAAPIYERMEADGSYIVGPDGRKVVRSDFAAVLHDIRTSPAVSSFPWLVKDVPEYSGSGGKAALGWSVPISDILEDPYLTLDPKRHCRKAASLVRDIEAKPHFKLGDAFDLIPQGINIPAKKAWVRKDETVYSYVDIDNIAIGDYRVTKMRGWELPQRGKHLAAPHDIYLGSIWSSVTKWCIVPLNMEANTVVTNGCHRLRIKKGMEEYLPDVLAFFCSEAYAAQMRSLARGSDGLAEIHESDVLTVAVPRIGAGPERKALIKLVEQLAQGAPNFRGAVRAMIDAGSLSIPNQPPRPHHSVLV